MKTCFVKMIWDDGFWCCETDAELGITLESPSFDGLAERVREAVPEMLALNRGYTGPVQIIFVTERVDILPAAI
ncbi:MAG: DUF1902 domain-containing protein [Defluviitaleaceae bacterium]|nr:DUF1902 domain-containing protein [Defluviitaleaceae bacterium]